MSEFQKSIKLDEPIKTKTGLISELRFRKPVAKDMLHLEVSGKMTLRDIHAIAMSTCEISSEKVFDNLSFSDLQKVIEVVSSFLESSPSTGKSESEG